MQRNVTIEQMFDYMDSNIIKKVIAFPVKSTLLVGLSIVLIEFDTHLPPALKQELTPLIAILTMIVLFWGFISGIADKVYYKYVVTGNKIEFTEVYFERSDYDTLTTIIESQNFTNLHLLRRTNKRGAKLKIAYSRDKKLGYVQAMKFIPFEYAQRSEVKQLEPEKIEELLSLISAA